MELNSITCMDALEFLQALPDASVHCIVTSPPYDDLRVYGGSWSFPFEAIAHEAYRVLMPGGVLVWVVGDSFKNGSETLTSMRQALFFVDSVGFKMHQRIIWQQLSMPTKRPKAYLPDFEDIFILSKGTPAAFNPIMKANKNTRASRKRGHSTKNGFEYVKGRRVTPDESILTNIWTMGVGSLATKDKIAFDHPAIFPEELARRCISTWTNPGDVVLDFFAGSGTTLKMAWALGRNYIGCDINPDYVKLAQERLANADPYAPSTLPNGSKQLSLFAQMADDAK